MTHQDCTYCLLAKTPDGKIFQVVIDQLKLKEYMPKLISGSTVKFLEPELQGITIGTCEDKTT